MNTVNEKSGFFNYMITEDGEPDRSYNATDFAKYFSLFVGDGVFINPANQLRVDYANDNNNPFNLIVRRGWAFIEGYYYELEDDTIITLPVNTETYNVTDSIVCTLDKAARKVTLEKRVNVGSGFPRNDGVLHDLVLALVSVKANASKIDQNSIVDTRPDKDYCGFVKNPLETLDLSEMFKQYYDAFEAWGADFQQTQNNYFEQQMQAVNAWVQMLQNKLTESAASDLQAQINELKYYYVSNNTLFLPNTNTSVSDHILFIGSSSQSEL